MLPQAEQEVELLELKQTLPALPMAFLSSHPPTTSFGWQLVIITLPRP
jgi:hypothetical protein